MPHQILAINIINRLYPSRTISASRGVKFMCRHLKQKRNIKLLTQRYTYSISRICSPSMRYVASVTRTKIKINSFKKSYSRNEHLKSRKASLSRCQRHHPKTMSQQKTRRQVLQQIKKRLI